MISIITINYNNATGLEKTIKSVKNQTYQDYEHIIIDGNSTDGSKEIIDKYKNSFNYWISEPDSGVYNAMNKGIKVSKGDFLFFLNSGDRLYDRDVLNKVSKEFNEKIDIYYGQLTLDNNAEEETIINPPRILSFDFFLTNTIPHQAVFTRKKIFKKVGCFTESLQIVSDWEFFLLSIFKFNTKYKKIDIIISRYDTTGISSIPENKRLFATERKHVLKKHFSQIIDDYIELQNKRIILSSNRFKMLNELENSIISKKINSFLLRIMLKIFTGKNVRDI